MSQFTHQSGKYFAIKGANIYYEEAGNPSKPVLLLLHGGGQHIEDLNSLVPWLANDFRLLGIDSRGHGKSTLGTAPLTYVFGRKPLLFRQGMRRVGYSMNG